MIFHTPYILAQCANNAHNALCLRHLTLAPNRLTTALRNPFIEHLGQQLRSLYGNVILTAYHDWPIGKGLTKIEAIYKSEWADQRLHNSATSFVKGEVSTKEPKKARLIQGNRNPITAYSLPAEYYAINHVLKGIMQHTFVEDGVEFKFVYAGGLSHAALSAAFCEAWNSRGQHFWLDERDGANWDATMNEGLLREEARFYDMLGSPVTAEFLRRSSKVIGKITTRLGLHERCTLKYLTSWKRLSGDWNTSCGNSLVSMIICYTVILGLPRHLRPAKITAFFLGDDYLSLMTFGHPVAREPLVEALNAGECSCGITPERGLTQDPLLVSFISLGLWPTLPCSSIPFQFVPHPAKQLCKLFATARRIDAKNAAAYCSEISRAFLPVYAGFEFMVSFLNAHYVPGLQAKASLRADLNYQHLYHLQFVSPTTIHWERGFLCKYRYPIQTLNFGNSSAFGCYNHPMVDHMLIYESSDPADRM